MGNIPLDEIPLGGVVRQFQYLIVCLVYPLPRHSIINFVNVE